MELDWVWKSLVTLVTLYTLVGRLNEWYYIVLKMGSKRDSLPPGHMGWPLLGNTLTFFKDFSYGHPDSFINNLVSKYGKSGIYKTHLFGNPSIIVCKPEMCKKVLTDDENFKLGYPKSISELAPSRPFYDVSTTERRRFRRLVTAPITGHNALAMYIERIEKIVIHSLEELSTIKHEPIELLKEMKKISFKVIIHVFMGSNNRSVITKIADLFAVISNAIFSISIDVPGFSFHKALKARKKLVEILQSVVEERKMMIKNGEMRDKKDLIDILLQLKGENGQNLEDEDIIDLLIGFLFAGHESTAIGMMWSIINLTKHPQLLKKAKEEQEEIIKKRRSSQRKLSLQEIKQMVYLSQVIDETLRLANVAFSTFREATTDVKINGYIIPKGWRVLVWGRAIHMDPEFYTNPEEFNPSRWDDYKGKAGTYLPFGAGSRLCPGSDLAKLEIHTLLHYFLLNYKLEQINPECGVTNLPSTKPMDNCLAKVIKVTDPIMLSD